MKYLLLSLIVLTTITTSAQTFQHFDALQVGTKDPITTGSIFDVKSTTKGALFPRMTTTQRVAISSPPDGLMVWDTNLHTLMEYNSGISGWVTPGMSSALSANKALKTDSNGLIAASSVTSTELGYLSGSGVTNGGLVYGNGSAFRVSGAGTSGDLLVSGGSGSPTWTTPTNANTVSTIVKRDSSGNFSAGTITATLSGNATSATNTAISDDTTTNATMYPTWVTTASGNQAQKVSSSKLTFNPSTANLTTTTFTGSLTGTASGNTSYTANNHGVVLSGSGNTMTVLAPSSSTTKVLTSGGASADPSWQDSTGGVTTVGTIDSQAAADNGLTISSTNVYAQSADATHPGMVNATTQTFGGTKNFSTINASSLYQLGGSTIIQAPATSNVFIGGAGNASPGSNYSFAAGLNALSAITSGSGLNVAIGVNGLKNASSPSQDVSLGVNACGGLTGSEQNDVCLGYASDISSGVSNSFAMGANASATASNSVAFGPTLKAEIGAAESGAPTAWLSLPSSTTSAHTAPIKIKSGSLMTSPEAGAIENDGTSLYYTSDTPTRINLTSGGSVGINFVTLNTSFISTKKDNSNADITVGDWLAYSDAAGTVPVDMTGGSPTITCLRTTTAGHVLNGSGSLEMIIDAANRQGEGCSVLVNVPPGYRGQNTTFQMAFLVETGTYVSGDLIMAVYDVTNSALLSVSSSTVTGTGLLKASLVIPSSTAQVRIGLHRAVATAAAVTLDFDDVVLGPNTNLGTMSVSSDWKNDLSFTPNGFGTVSAPDYRYKRVGDLMMVKGYFKSGTTATSTCSISLPTGYTIDSSKLTSTTNAQQVGWGSRVIHSATPGSTFAASDNHVYFYDGSDTAKVYLARQVASDQFTKFNCSSDYSNSDGVTFEISIPITQWATNGTTITPSQVANIWSGYHDNTCSWTVTNTAYTDFALDASCALVERVNQNFGTVSTSGSVKPAITFTPSRLGVYEVCVSGTVADATIAKLVAIRLWDGTTVIAERDFVQAVATDGTNFTLCGNYKATSLSAVTLSLQGQSDAGALTLAAVRATTALEWSLHQIDVNTPMPYFVGAISSPSTTGVEYVMRANLTCSSSSAINNQSGTWITSIGNVSSGKCIVTLSGSPFSSTAYDCSITENGTLVNGIRGWNINNKSTSSFDIYGASITSASSTIAAITNETFDILCMGPH